MVEVADMASAFHYRSANCCTNCVVIQNECLTLTCGEQMVKQRRNLPHYMEVGPGNLGYRDNIESTSKRLAQINLDIRRDSGMDYVHHGKNTGPKIQDQIAVKYWKCVKVVTTKFQFTLLI